MPKGVYQVVLSSIFYGTTAASHDCGYRLNDGVVVTSGQSSNNTSGSAVGVPVLNFNFHNPSNRQNVELTLEARYDANSAGCNLYSTEDNENLKISVYYYPDLSEDGIEVPKMLPIVDGTVTSSAGTYSKKMRVESCTASSAALTLTSDCNSWIDSVTLVSTGTFDYTIKSGIFADIANTTCIAGMADNSWLSKCDVSETPPITNPVRVICEDSALQSRNNVLVCFGAEN
jgi:hypothetical protein